MKRLLNAGNRLHFTIYYEKAIEIFTGIRYTNYKRVDKYFYYYKILVIAIIGNLRRIV